MVDHPEKDDDNEGGSEGGQSGAVQFHFTDERLGSHRDDLTPQDIKTQTLNHHELHQRHVNDLKQTLAEREALKARDKNAPAAYELGAGGSDEKQDAHPILSKKAQWDGVDKTVAPTDKFDSKANPENKDELKNRLRLAAQPKFNPRPKFPG